jgi:hypothetical protein
MALSKSGDEKQDIDTPNSEHVAGSAEVILRYKRVADATELAAKVVLEGGLNAPLAGRVDS